MSNNYIYGVVNTADFLAAAAAGRVNPSDLFAAVVESGFNTLRYSLDRTEFVLKAFNGVDTRTHTMPANYLRNRAAALGIQYTEYDHDEILILMATPHWTDPEEDL